MKVGVYLTNLMKKLGLTQQKLADMTGLSQSYISHICLDRNQPSLDTIEKICNAVNVPISSFFADGELLVRDITHSVSLLSYQEACLISQYRLLSDANQGVVNTMVETLLNAHPPEIFQKSPTSTNGSEKEGTGKRKNETG